MCGIAAVCCAGAAEGTLRQAHNAIQALQHRGPDGSAIWQSRDGSVCLGHSRLAINDISGGSQPISNEDGTVVAVVNGEFYEFQQIRKRLIQLGHRFTSASDSEIVVHLYEQFGFSALEQLQGEFAFVLWDERQHRLWAARDRFGAKPLYYAEDRNGVVFASEIKGLKQAGISLAWDPEGFFDQFIFQTGLNGRTLFKGVFELPPGFFLVRQGHTSRIQKYWDLSYPLQASDHDCGQIGSAEPDDVYADALLKLLEESVRSRVQTDLPVACYLSGGLDSTSLCALLQRNVGYPVQAFSLSFDHPDYDEFALAEQSAIALGVGITKVPINSSMLAANFAKAVWHCESLITNANAVAKFCLSRAVREAGYRVVLTGEGADELFAGYENFAVDHLRHGSRTEREALRQALGNTEAEMQELLYPDGVLPARSLMSRLGYVPAWMEPRYWTHEQFESIFPGSFARRDLGQRLLSALDVEGQLEGRCTLSRSLYIHSKTSLSGVTLPALGDRVEMAHSVEARLTFLDHRVVDFARNLPCSLKIRQGAEKYVLRKALSSLIPAEVCGRRKRALVAPPAVTQNNSVFGEMLQDTLRSASLQSIPFLNHSAVLGILDWMPALAPMQKQAWDGPLTALTSACMLSEQFISSVCGDKSSEAQAG